MNKELIVAIIAIAKNENLYVNEWIDYHLNLGFDNIIVCDNNDNGSEKISDVVNNPHVYIEDYHNVKYVQPIAYTEMFLKYKGQFDWIAFIDVDEFIMLDKKYNNIKDFLSDSLFENATIIRLCWKIYTTNTDLDVKDNNYNVLERFKDLYISGKENKAKSIINTSLDIKNEKIYGHGYYDCSTKKVFSSDGKQVKFNYVNINSESDKPIYKNAWINHYPTKTIGEFIRQKYFRGGPNNNGGRYSSLDYFFTYNEKTEERIKYAKKIIIEMEKEKK